MAKKMKYADAYELELAARTVLGYPLLPSEATDEKSAVLLSKIIVNPDSYTAHLTQQYAIPDVEFEGVTDYDFPIRKSLQAAVNKQASDKKDKKLAKAVKDAEDAGTVEDD